MKRYGLAAMGLGLFLFVACGESTAPVGTARSGAGPADEPPGVQFVADLARGEELFNRNCVTCHGVDGDGKGDFAHLLNPRPRNFTADPFKLAATENQVPTDADLIRTLERGMPGSAMPPWAHLPQADLASLAGYVRSIFVASRKAELDRYVAEGLFTAEDARSELVVRAEPSAAITLPEEPIFDEIHWFNGRTNYLQACASCHGADGHPVAGAVKFDDAGYPVMPRSFANGIFKGGSSSEQLMIRVLKGVRGTPMPAYEGTYSDEGLWDMVHYIQSLARPGAQERAELKEETFRAVRAKDGLPAGPADAAWLQAESVYVALTPLWWAEDRIEGVTVEAMHDGEELAIRLSWLDPVEDSRAVGMHEFRDAVAIQFSMTPDPPFFMGSTEPHGQVNVWLWKADRARDIAEGYQDVDAAFPNRAVDMYPEQNYKTPLDRQGAPWPTGPIGDHKPEFITAWGAGNVVAGPGKPSAVETLVASSPGTLAQAPMNFQIVQGASVYQNGVWRVQLSRAMGVEAQNGNGGQEGEGEERVFDASETIPIAFAIWNGSAGDRDGKKNISVWQKLIIE